MYAVWLAITLAAILGVSKALPITGMEKMILLGTAHADIGNTVS